MRDVGRLRALARCPDPTAARQVAYRREGLATLLCFAPANHQGMKLFMKFIGR